MQLGSFWGVTAPMLLLFDEINYEGFDETAFVELLNSQINGYILANLREELDFFRRAFADSDVKYVSEFDTEENKVVLESHKDRILSKGSYPSDEEWVICFKRYVVIEVCKRILKGLACGESVSIGSAKNYGDVSSVRSAIIDLVEEWLSKNNVKYSTVRVAVKGIYGSIVSDHTNFSKNHLCDAFKIKVIGNPSLIKDGLKVKLDDRTVAIWQWYYERLERVDRYFDMIKISKSKEKLVFGTNFRDVIKRKPISLQFIVINEFRYVKDRPKASFLKKVMESVRTNVETYKKCLTTDVRVKGMKADLQLLTKEAFSGMLSEWSVEKAMFFNKLRIESKLVLDDLLEKDFRIISDLYDLLSRLDVKCLNTIFGIVASEEDWEGILIPELIELGIAGLNLYSIDLFGDSICNISLVASDKIQKSEEDVKKIMSILEDVDALLDTLRPIGGSIDA